MGGNNVASLIMKHLQDCEFFDGKKWKRLNIVMDNCPGQNKNNFVLRLAPYLQEKEYFEEVNFNFPGCWTHQECCGSSIQYSEKTLQEAQCFHDGNAA